MAQFCFYQSHWPVSLANLLLPSQECHLSWQTRGGSGHGKVPFKNMLHPNCQFLCLFESPPHCSFLSCDLAFFLSQLKLSFLLQHEVCYLSVPLMGRLQADCPAPQGEVYMSTVQDQGAVVGSPNSCTLIRVLMFASHLQRDRDLQTIQVLVPSN